MVDIQSQSDGMPETRASTSEPMSAFRVYLEQNPEMSSEILRVMLQLY